jgi:Domain of unknown function (DUF5666)
LFGADGAILADFGYRFALFSIKTSIRNSICQGRETVFKMRFQLSKTASATTLAIVVFGGLAGGQNTPERADVGSPAAISSAAGSATSNATESAANLSSAAERPATERPATGQPEVDRPEIALDPSTLIPDPSALPTKRISMVGGVIEKLDRVKDHMTLRIFGGGTTKIAFDPRTKMYRDGATATAADLQPGERVYVDTVLNGGIIFARSIRITTASIGESQGTVINFESSSGELTVRDPLSPRPIKVRVTAATKIVNIKRSEGNISREILPGSLIELNFVTRPDKQIVASDISILAEPEGEVAFKGRITGLDLSSSTLSLVASDGRTYEIHLDPKTVTIDEGLREAADVTVLARFHANSYVAYSVSVNE